MGKWSVSETGLNYLMEYTNGFKRSIRRSQVAKTSQGAIVTYASSQSPNLTLAEQLYYIQSYTAGTSTIDFTNNGGDDWDIGFKIAPTSKQPSGLVIDSYDFNVFFWSAGTDTEIEVDTKNTDYDLNTSGNGAGVYQIDQNYLDSNGDVLFTVLRFIKVDGSGNILADYQYLGAAVSSVSGLSMVVSAEVNEVNCTNTIQYYAFDEENPTQTLLVGSGLSDTLSLPIWTKFVTSLVTLDSVFTSDYIQIPKASISITIN